MRELLFWTLIFLSLALAACRSATPAPVCPTPLPAPPGAITPENMNRLVGTRTLDAGERILRLAFHPQSDILATAIMGGRVRLWRVSDGALLRTLEMPRGGVWSLAFSPGGEVLAVGQEDDGGGDILLWRVSDGVLLRTLKGHTDAVHALAFSPDGSLLASGSWDFTARLWRVADGALLHTLEGDTTWVRNLVFSPDGTLLATGSSYDLWLWRVTDGSLLRTFSVPRNINIITESPQGLAFSPDGAVLAVAQTRGISFWNVSEANPPCASTYTPEHLEEFQAVISPNWALLATGSPNDGLVRLWRLPDAVLLRTLEHDDAWEVTSLAFSPDGAVLAVGLDNGTVQLWEIRE